MNRIPWYVYVLSIFLLIGLVAPKDSEPTAEPVAPTSTAVPTERPTIDSSVCYGEYIEIAEETLARLPIAGSVEGIDALIQRYDAIKLPYACGDGELLDTADMAIRLALGNARTFMQTGNAEYDTATGVQMYQAYIALDKMKAHP